MTSRFTHPTMGHLLLLSLFLVLLPYAAHAQGRQASPTYWEDVKANVQVHGEHGGFHPLFTEDYSPDRDKTLMLMFEASTANDSAPGYDTSWSIRVMSRGHTHSEASITIKTPGPFLIKSVLEFYEGTEYTIQWGFHGEKVRDNYKYYVRGSDVKASAHLMVKGNQIP